MNLVVTSRGGDVPPGLKQHLEKKLKKLERLSMPSSQLHVLIVHERAERRVEVWTRAYGQDLRAEGHGEDLVACADAALGKLAVQLKKRKDRITDHSAHRSRSA